MCSIYKFTVKIILCILRVGSETVLSHAFLTTRELTGMVVRVCCGVDVFDSVFQTVSGWLDYAAWLLVM